MDKRLLKIGMAIYAVIFTLIAIDVFSDYEEGTEWSHIITEIVVMLVAVIGLSLLARAYYASTQETMQTLALNLEKAQVEAQRWREESRELIRGLGVEIQRQFVRWGLTHAESEVGLLILKGFSHQEIANLRGASERTVREQARTLYRKAGLASRSELSAFFLEDLLLPMPSKEVN